MNIFSFSWSDYQDTYQRDGWVHIKDGITPEFLEVAREVVATSAAGPLSGKGLKGAKDQFLFDFPASVDYRRDLFDVLGPMTGLEPANMTLSERHVKAYQPDADPRPAAHKDRLSSQIAVGLSVEVPTGSHLVIYPESHRGVNPFFSTGLRDSLEPDQLPEVILCDAPEVEIHDSPGDVIVFPGSSLWHLRRNSAGTVNIYLKFNDFDADPLGEDPTTMKRRAATLAALQGGVGGLGSTVPVLSRRFDLVARNYSRDGWQESLSAVVWGGPPVPISEAEFGVVRCLGRGRSFSDLVASGTHGLDATRAEQAIRHLAERGVVDLLT